MEFLNINIENHKELKTGRLLIAQPFLSDPNFTRSVILLCEHGQEGSVGFILNKPTEITLGDLLPELYTPTLTIAQGGPVQKDTLHMLHMMPEALGGNKIVDGVYWGGSYEALQEVISDKTYEPEKMKLFLGYSGWSPGQLEKEIEEGSWLVADMSTEVLVETSPKLVWKKAIGLLGKEYAILANMPLNPQLN